MEAVPVMRNRPQKLPRFSPEEVTFGMEDHELP